MKRTASTVAAAMLLTSPVKAEPVTDKLLDALAWAESNNNPDAVGKHNEYGRWQMTEDVVLTVYFRRRAFGETVSNALWMCDANDPEIVRDWLQIECNLWFLRQTGRMPTLAELVATHNAPQLFKKRGFKVSRMPAATKRLVKEVEARMK